MKIEYLDLFYWINNAVQLDISFQVGYLSKIVKNIPAIGDLSELEFYEIVRMPVVQLIFHKKHQDSGQAGLLVEIFCCTCSQGHLFIYRFSGKGWLIGNSRFNASNR